MSLLDTPSLISTVTGTAILLLLLYQLLSFLTFHFTPSTPTNASLLRYQRSPRAWALVTGSSGGIGLGHIQELAARGFGVIIHAHIASEVAAAVALIKSEFPDHPVESIVLDARTASHDDIVAALKPFTTDPTRPLTILINNLALQSSVPVFAPLTTFTPSDITTSIHVTATFAVQVTHILYPTLLSNSPSLILNTTSAAHILGLPFLTTYCAAKSFNATFSRALARESHFHAHNVDVVAIMPGDVRTPGNRFGCPTSAPTGREFARAVWRGKLERAVKRGDTVFSPLWTDAVVATGMKWVPENWLGPAAGRGIYEGRVKEEARARMKVAEVRKGGKEE